MNDNFYFSKLSEFNIEDFLTNARNYISGITNQNHFGIYSYSHINDSSFLKAFKSAGYNFEFCPGYPQSFYPETDATNGFYIFVNTGLRGYLPCELNDLIERNEGISFFNSDTFSNGFYPNINNKNIWVTTFSDLIEWVNKKNYLKVSVIHKSDQLEVKLENNSSTSVENIGVWIPVPDISKNIYLSGQNNAAELSFNSQKKMFYLKVDSLNANQTRSFYLKGIE